MKTDPVRRLIKDIRETLIPYEGDKNVCGIILYGSWARGEQTAHSDVDIAVICKDKKTADEYCRKTKHLYSYKGYLLEIRFYDYGFLSKSALPENYSEGEYKNLWWTESNRFLWKHSLILHDSEKKVWRLLRGKNKSTEFPRKERLSNMRLLKRQIETALNYDLPRMIKARRCEESQALMNTLVGKVAHYIYSQNGLLMPSEKYQFLWLRRHMVSGIKYVRKLLEQSEPRPEVCRKRRLKFFTVCHRLNLPIKKMSVSDFTKKLGAVEWK